MIRLVLIVRFVLMVLSAFMQRERIDRITIDNLTEIVNLTQGV